MPISISDKVDELCASVPGFDATLRDSKILEAQYFLQPYTGLSDAEVEVEASYSNQQRLLVAYIASKYVYEKALMDSGASSGGGAGKGSLKKAKADVVESEFYDEGIYAFKLTGQQTLQALSNNACDIASKLCYNLPFCDLYEGDLVPVPFLHFPILKH